MSPATAALRARRHLVSARREGCPAHQRGWRAPCRNQRRQSRRSGRARPRPQAALFAAALCRMASRQSSSPTNISAHRRSSSTSPGRAGAGPRQARRAAESKPSRHADAPGSGAGAHDRCRRDVGAGPQAPRRRAVIALQVLSQLGDNESSGNRAAMSRADRFTRKAGASSAKLRESTQVAARRDPRL